MNPVARSPFAQLLVLPIVYGVALLAAILAGGAVTELGAFWRALLGTVVATLVVFLGSVTLRNTSVYDPYWSVGPIALAAFWAKHPAGPGVDAARVVLVLLLVVVWGGRLTANFLIRWRGLDDEDWRYADLRTRTGGAFWLVSLFGLHLMPTALVFLGMIPVFAVLTAPSTPFGILDVVALAVTATAIAWEWVADRQLRAFLRSDPPRGAHLERGLWAWSRHPNYLGEIGFWWGLWLFAVAASPDNLWTGVGAVLITCLFVGVSVPMMERRHRARRPGWEAYAARVGRLLPWRRRG